MLNFPDWTLSQESRTRMNELLKSAPEVGLSPDSIASGGLAGLQTLIAQRAKHAGLGNLRSKYIARAQEAVRRLNPAIHDGLLQQVQSSILALQNPDMDPTHTTQPDEVQVAADASPPSNDNFPRRAEACDQAGWECVESGLTPDERKGCFPAEQQCQATAEAYKKQPPNVAYVGRFPHGRTVIIPGGGKPPYLGPMTPRKAP